VWVPLAYVTVVRRSPWLYSRPVLSGHGIRRTTLRQFRRTRDPPDGCADTPVQEAVSVDDERLVVDGRTADPALAGEPREVTDHADREKGSSGPRPVMVSPARRPATLTAAHPTASNAMAIAATRGQPRVVDPIDTRSRRPATTIVLPTTPSHETSRSNEGGRRHAQRGDETGGQEKRRDAAAGEPTTNNRLSPVHATIVVGSRR